ncbi:MAG: hypothetical protein AAGC46_07585 [Solirubrobacteraceae bacterium]
MPALRSLALVAAGGVALVAAPATALAGPLGSTTLVDRPGGGALPADGASFSIFQSAESMSADGNRVVFESEADGLAAPDGNPDSRYVYLRDRATGTTTNVCRASGGKGALADGDCHNASISRNGRYVTFASRATNLVSEELPADSWELYRRDLQTGVTSVISRRSGVAGAVSPQGVNERGSVADDGTVVFTTYDALDPVHDTAAHADVYARVGTTTVLLSRTAGGTPGNAASDAPVISGDGSTVAFETASSNFSAGDTNGVDDVYSAPISGTATPSLESRKPSSATAGTARSGSPVLSQTGRYVAFQTDATNLFSAPITADTNGAQDVILRDRDLNTNTVASISAGGVLGNGGSSNPSISADGSLVGFSTGALNLGGGAVGDNGVAIVRNPSTNTTAVTSTVGGPGTAAIGGYIGGISSSASVVAVGLSDVPGSGGNTLIYAESIGGSVPELLSRPTGSGPLAQQNAGYASMTEASVSADGRFVTFVSSTSGLVSGPTDGVEHVYVRDQLLGATTLVDRAGGPAGPPADTYADSAVISDDGSKVAFISRADDLVPGVSDGREHLFVVDRATGAVVAADRTSSGVVGTADADDPTLSADGTTVVFTTDGPLVSADTNGVSDVYVRNLLTGTTTLASRATGAGGTISAAGGYAGVVSGDGTKVGFTSVGGDLAPGDTNADSDAFVRDLTTTTTTLVSRAGGADGSVGVGGGSSIVDLSADGSKALFSSRAGNLGDGPTNAELSFHVRDLATATTTWASRTATGANPTGDAANGSISSDGTHVAFASSATNQLAVDANGSSADAYVRDLSAGTTARVSLADGAAGAQAAREVSGVSLSGDGRCVVFSTSSTGLVAGGYASTDFTHVYERAVGGDCPVVPPAAPAAPGPDVPAGSGAAAGGRKDTLAPTLSKLALTRKAFAVKGRKKGTTVRVRVSEAVSLNLAVATLTRGARKGKGCVTPAKAPKRAKACMLAGRPNSVKTVAAPAGTTTIPFDGKVGRKTLKRGAYRFVLTATDAAGNRGTASIDFTVR